VQKMDGPILTICMSYDVFLHKQVPFGNRNDCTCVKRFTGNNFYLRQRSYVIAVVCLSVR